MMEDQSPLDHRVEEMDQDYLARFTGGYLHDRGAPQDIVDTSTFHLRDVFETLVKASTELNQFEQQPPTFTKPSRHDQRCRLCRKIRIQTGSQRESFKHYKYFDLKVSASRGCPVCRYLFNEVALDTIVESDEAPLTVVLHDDLMTVADYTGRLVRFEFVTNSGRSNHASSMMYTTLIRLYR